MTTEKTIGRPTTFTEEMGAKICEKLASGLSLRAICKEDWAPAQSTVFLWKYKHKSFSEQYALAREAWAEAEFDNMMQIADDGTNDFREVAQVGGATIVEVDHDHIARSRLRVDTRKWALSKMMPDKFGDRIKNEITNPDGSLQKMDETAMVAKLKAILLEAKRKFEGNDASDLV